MKYIKCQICGRTSENCRIRTIKNMSLCPKHLAQHYRNKQFLETTIYDKNNYILDDKNKIYKIELKNKYCEIVGYALIDIDDYDKCKKVNGIFDIIETQIMLQPHLKITEKYIFTD